MTLSTSINEVRAFVTRSLGNLQRILHDDAEKAKPALAKLLGQLTLTPRETTEGPVYEGIDLLPQEEASGVMLVVARDGIEPPTHGFSVRCSTS